MKRPPLCELALAVIDAHRKGAGEQIIVQWDALADGEHMVPGQSLSQRGGDYYRLAIAQAPVLAAALLDNLSTADELRAHVRFVSEDRALLGGSYVQAAGVFRLASQLDRAWNGEKAAHGRALVDIVNQIRMDLPVIREDAKQADTLLRGLIDAMPADLVENNETVRRLVYAADAFVKRSQARQEQALRLSDDEFEVLDEAVRASRRDGQDSDDDAAVTMDQLVGSEPWK